jgi:trimeric autotransporter adhesin
MSTKTLRKRIALTAVTALGAGLLSVVSTPAANAFYAGAGSADVINVATTNSDTATAVAIGTIGGARSVGLLAADTTTALAGTATLLATGTIVVSNGSSGTAATFSVVGGTIVAASTVGVTIGTSQTTADITTNAGAEAIAVRPNSGVTTMTISLSSGTAAAPTGLLSRLTVTVVAASTVGVYSAADSFINTANTAGSDSLVVDGIDQVNATTGSATVIPNGGTGKVNFSLRDSFGNLVPASVFTASASAGGFVNISGTNGVFTETLGSTSAVDVEASRNSGSVTVTQAVANAPVTVTVTLAYRGVTIGTKTFSFQGEVARVTVTPTKVGKTSSTTNTDAANITYADSAGNVLFPTNSPITSTVVTASMGDQTIVNGVTVANYPSRTATGKVTISCNATAGTAPALQIRHLNIASGTVVLSNTWAQTCAGAATSLTASWDKASYTPGSIAVLTLSFKDSKGFAANSYDLLDTMTITGSPSSTTAQAGASVTPLNPHAARGGGLTGAITQTYVVGTTTGDFVAVVVPADSLKTAATAAGTSQANLSVAYKIASGTTTVTNEQVLASIVSLIASINKQIVALQKLILQRR